jgi:hypothetical protein
MKTGVGMDGTLAARSDRCKHWLLEMRRNCMREWAFCRAFGADGQYWRGIAAALFASLLLSTPLLGHSLAPEQIVYAGQGSAQGVAMHAEWSEPDGTMRRLDFDLPAAALAPSTRRIVPPSREEAQRIGFAAAQAEALRAPAGIRIDVQPVEDGVKANASGPVGVDMNGPLHRVMAAYDIATQQAILDAGYRPLRPGWFEPDWPRLVREQAALLGGTARDIDAQLAGLTPRDKVQFLNSFMQSIPYETLNTRGRSPMRTPAGVLADNRGDCDAKSIALATLLATIAPELSTVLVYGDNHAFLGVSLPAMPGDTAFSVGGRSYVALEPVGPGWFPAGTLSPMSQAILAGGRAQTAQLHP